MRFTNIIGENSTVLYEALSMGKKVAKLEMKGLIPLYLKKEDQKLFHIIKDNDDFIEFMNSPIPSKPNINIYSKYKEDVFNMILNS